MSVIMPANAVDLSVEYAEAIGLTHGKHWKSDDDGVYLLATDDTIRLVNRFMKEQPDLARQYLQRFRQLGMGAPPCRAK